MKTFYEVKFVITIRSELYEKGSLSSTRVIYNIRPYEIESNIHRTVMKLEESLVHHHKENWKEKNITIFLEYIKAIKEPYKFEEV